MDRGVGGEFRERRILEVRVEFFREERIIVIVNVVWRFSIWVED